MRSGVRSWTEMTGGFESVRTFLGSAGWVISAVAIAVVAFGVAAWHLAGVFPTDTRTYFLAGVRLNSGGQLYDLRPTDPWPLGDRQFPLFGPPLIAVPWRALAVIP